MLGDTVNYFARTFRDCPVVGVFDGRGVVSVEQRKVLGAQSYGGVGNAFSYGRYIAVDFVIRGFRVEYFLSRIGFKLNAGKVNCTRGEFGFVIYAIVKSQP